MGGAWPPLDQYFRSRRPLSEELINDRFGSERQRHKQMRLSFGALWDNTSPDWIQGPVQSLCSREIVSPWFVEQRALSSVTTWKQTHLFFNSVSTMVYSLMNITTLKCVLPTPPPLLKPHLTPDKRLSVNEKDACTAGLRWGVWVRAPLSSHRCLCKDPV